MRKRIPVEQLSVGMFLWAVDKPELETAFYRHRQNITDAQQVSALRKSGVQYVEIETDKAVGVLCLDEFAHTGPEPVVEAIPVPPEACRAEPASEPPPTPVAVPPVPSSFEDELPIAKKIYQDAKTIVQQAMTDLRMGREINTDQVGKVVDGLADSVLRNPAALTSLSRLKSFDEYTFFHSVNTAVLALGLGRNLGMPRETLHLLGMGTLLHDVGKTRIPLEILNKPGRYAPSEYEIMKQHALRGAEILSATPGLKEEAIKPALEHHERVDGTGYPFQRKQSDLSLFGLIGSVVDIYDAMTSERVYHTAMPPHKALQFLYDLGQKGHLAPELVQRFIHCVGVYPVGSCVKLNTGEIGVVQEIHHDQPLLPSLLLVRDANGKPKRPPEVLDLAAQQNHPPRTIMNAQDPLEIGLRPAVYLDRVVA